MLHLSFMYKGMNECPSQKKKKNERMRLKEKTEIGECKWSEVKGTREGDKTFDEPLMNWFILL